MTWVLMASGASGSHGVLQSGENGTCNRPLQLFSKGQSMAVWGGGVGCDATLSASTAVPAPVNGWHHYAYVVDGSGTRLYIDGVLRTLTYKTGTAATQLFFGQVSGGLSRYRIGATELAEETFDGIIDDFRVYATPMTPAQIQAAMNAGYCS